MGFAFLAPTMAFNWVSYIDIHFYGEVFSAWKERDVGFFCVEGC